MPPTWQNVHKLVYTANHIKGTYSLSSGYYDAYYVRGLKVRTLIKNDFDEAFKTVDAILTPTSPTTAFKIGERVNDPLSMYLNDICTIGASLAGLPALSLNGGFCPQGLPVGVQLIGSSMQELTLLQTAYALEQQLALDNCPPVLQNAA